jgi:hypothetical protein
MPWNKNKFDSDERNEIERANRIEELESLVETHTRTERHLEQHSDIASSKGIRDAEKKQAEREDIISSLEDKIAHGASTNTDEAEGLEKNYIFAKGYMEHNADHMPKEDLENLKGKQQNRRDKMNGIT